MAGDGYAIRGEALVCSFGDAATLLDPAAAAPARIRESRDQPQGSPLATLLSAQGHRPIQITCPQWLRFPAGARRFWGALVRPPSR